MAEQQQKTTSTKTVDKWKRKKWYTVNAPASFNQILLGETPAAKPNALEGRTVQITLDKLTNDRKQRHITITFQVKRVQGLNANTETMGHEIKNSYLGKMIRRRKSKIDVVATVTTKDGKQSRITCACLCGSRIPNPVETQLRKLIEEELMDTGKRRDFEQFVQELIFGNFAAKVFKRAKNLAFIKRIEVTKSRVLTEPNKEPMGQKEIQLKKEIPLVEETVIPPVEAEK